MKILIVTPRYYPEGFSFHTMAEAWAKEGHDVLVVTDKPNYGFGRVLPEYRHVSDEVINGVRVHRCPSFARKDSRVSIIANYLSYYLSCKHYLSHLKEHFDVVYSFQLSPVISISGANVYAKKHKVRHVLHCLDLWPESVISTEVMSKKSLGYKILYHWSRLIYRKADEILVSSPSFKGYFRDVLKLPETNVTYVPQPPYIVEKAGEDFKYPCKNAFLYAGNIGTLQLVENLIKAFSSLPSEVDATLYIIGMGSHQKKAEELSKAPDAKGRVVYLGQKNRQETARYYGNAAGVIVSLAHKGYVGSTIPNKLISSLYYEKAILGIIEGDGRKVLEETGGAILSKGEDPSSIKEAVISFLKLSEDERKEMGKRNKAYFLENLSFASCKERISEHLKKQ